MEDKDIFDRLMHLPGLRLFEPFYKRFKEQLLYLFFGVLTTIVNLIVFWLALHSLPPLGANIIAWIAGVLFAYVTNRTWVFRSSSGSIVREFISFCGGRIVTLLMEELILWSGIDLLHIHAMVVKIIAQILVVVGNYIISKWFVFKEE
ncbi:MAG: GtrA family protein [Eubacteriales bacterium]|nr:GtrA family protein [Eubacteriales bacterium]